jgi:hypothetical protein
VNGLRNLAGGERGEDAGLAARLGGEKLPGTGGGATGYDGLVLLAGAVGRRPGGGGPASPTRIILAAGRGPF